MTSIPFAFLQPYISILLGMAYSLQQALEGLGINTTQFEPLRNSSGDIVGSSLDAGASLIGPLLLVLVFLSVWFVLIMIALRALWGRRAMLAGLLLMMVPGLLSIVNLWPPIPWLPRTYVIGSGYPGSPWGMLALQVFALTTGWALTVWLTRRLQLDDRFRHGYDQFWYALAISAGLFFVADLDANEQRDALRQSATTSQSASRYLLEQVRNLDDACQTGQLSLPLACEWARQSQWQLDSYAGYNEKLYWKLGPEQEWQLYTASNASRDDKAVDALRQELHRYNLRVCPIADLGEGLTQNSRISRTCQYTPSAFCTTFPSRNLPGVDRIEAATRTVAVANECIIPTLYRLKSEQASLARSVEDNAIARHLRTLFFIFVSLIAGGKVANASVRMTDAIQNVRKNNEQNATAGAPARWPQSFSRYTSLKKKLSASILKRSRK